MRLARDVNVTVAQRVQDDVEFANALLGEAAALLLNGEPDATRLILRNLVYATIGFEGLAVNLGIQSKSVRKMLTNRGNPSMNHIAAIFRVLSKSLNVNIEVRSRRFATPNQVARRRRKADIVLTVKQHKYWRRKVFQTLGPHK